MRRRQCNKYLSSPTAFRDICDTPETFKLSYMLSNLDEILHEARSVSQMCSRVENEYLTKSFCE